MLETTTDTSGPPSSRVKTSGRWYERIIRYAFRVANKLGHGFVVKVSENALAHEISKCGLNVVQQSGIVLLYDDVIVGEYTPDLLVEDQVIVELKVVSALSDMHIPQRRTDLSATGKPLCLLINFGRPTVEIHRGAAQA